MQITVQLLPTVAQELAERSPPSNETQALQQALSRFALALQPLHPGTDDPVLRTQFWLEVSDSATADAVLQQLLELKAVVAAYRKPPDAPP